MTSRELGRRKRKKLMNEVHLSVREEEGCVGMTCRLRSIVFSKATTAQLNGLLLFAQLLFLRSHLAAVFPRPITQSNVALIHPREWVGFASTTKLAPSLEQVSLPSL
jgi:hypothetical protein